MRTFLFPFFIFSVVLFTRQQTSFISPPENMKEGEIYTINQKLEELFQFTIGVYRPVLFNYKIMDTVNQYRLVITGYNTVTHKDSYSMGSSEYVTYEISETCSNEENGVFLAEGICEMEKTGDKDWVYEIEMKCVNYDDTESCSGIEYALYEISWEINTGVLLSTFFTIFGIFYGVGFCFATFFPSFFCTVGWIAGPILMVTGIGIPIGLIIIAIMTAGSAVVCVVLNIIVFLLVTFVLSMIACGMFICC